MDELTTRANPKRVVEQGRRTLTATLAEPKVKYSLIAVGALLAVVVDPAACSARSPADVRGGRSSPTAREFTLFERRARVTLGPGRIGSAAVAGLPCPRKSWDRADMTMIAARKRRR